MTVENRKINSDVNAPSDLPSKEKPLKRFPRRARRGLIGVLITIAIVIAALVYIFGYARSAWTSTDSTALLTQIRQVQDTVDSAWRFRGNYTNGSMTETVIVRGGFSGKAVSGVSPNRTIITPYDTTITVAGNGARDYTITIADIPSEACFLSIEPYLNSSEAIDGISVDGTAVTLPLTETAVDTACVGQADNQYTVALTF
jgi:Flp pilus assembly pilin Flp